MTDAKKRKKSLPDETNKAVLVSLMRDVLEDHPLHDRHGKIALGGRALQQLAEGITLPLGDVWDLIEKVLHRPRQLDPNERAIVAAAILGAFAIRKGLVRKRSQETASRDWDIALDVACARMKEPDRKLTSIKVEVARRYKAANSRVDRALKRMGGVAGLVSNSPLIKPPG